jgi:hypothetical protein
LCFFIDAPAFFFPDFNQSACRIIMQHRDIGRYDATHANALGFRFHSDRNVYRIPIECDVAPEITFSTGNDLSAMNSNAKIGAYAKAVFILCSLLLNRGGRQRVHPGKAAGESGSGRPGTRPGQQTAVKG